jgi:sugar O-acyltransferase (sialic acid O-acetyltransferase NeuD family)
MILAGAGGHALEVYDILKTARKLEQLEIFDQDLAKKFFNEIYPIIYQPDLLESAEFCLGIGSVDGRKYLYELMKRSGKVHFVLRGTNSVISPSAQLNQVDVFHHCFIGPQTQLGIGCIVNTGAQVHHEVQVGDFTVINPGAFLLGAVQVGDYCSIGSHATILPGIRIGNGVTVGAGAVVTKSVPDGVTVIGVPARIRKQ